MARFQRLVHRSQEISQEATIRARTETSSAVVGVVVMAATTTSGGGSGIGTTSGGISDSTIRTAFVANI